MYTGVSGHVMDQVTVFETSQMKFVSRILVIHQCFKTSVPSLLK
jgi:hypothetical protein